jgi:glycosyltransferase involved in cell wall biosynthesis
MDARPDPSIRDTLGRDDPPLGVAVATYNRLPGLQECVQRLQAHTARPLQLVVADDGSTDGTSEWCREAGIPCVTGVNRGIAWNKNRGLHYLFAQTAADPIFILEDDARIWEDGWETDWVAAAQRWGQINFSEHVPVSGSGTPDDPYWCHYWGGVCTGTTRGALKQVGYLDTLFGGYGHEHWEWTRRYQRYLRWPGPKNCVPCLRSHVGILYEHSWFDPDSHRRNKRLAQLLVKGAKRGDLFRYPAADKDEQEILAGEIALALDPAPGVKRDVRLAHLAYLQRVSELYMTLAWPLAATLWRLLDERKPGSILDLGSGFSSYLFRRWAASRGAPRGVRVLSVDGSSHWLSRTETFLEGQGVKVEPGSLTVWPDVPEEPGGWDFIFHDMGHIYERYTTLADALRLRNPSGAVVLDDMHYAPYAELARAAAERDGLRFLSLREESLDSYRRHSALLTL